MLREEPPRRAAQAHEVTVGAFGALAIDGRKVREKEDGNHGEQTTESQKDGAPCSTRTLLHLGRGRRCHGMV